MITSKVIKTQEKSYKSTILMQTYQECEDCGERNYARYPLKVTIEHRYPMVDEQQYTVIKIPIDNNHYVFIRVHRTNILNRSLNNIVDDIATSEVLMEDLVLDRKQVLTKWNSRNYMDMCLFDGLGTEELDECRECYDPDYEDEYGDNNIGTAMDVSNMYITIEGHLGNTVQLNKVVKHANGVFKDMTRTFEVTPSDLTIGIGNVKIKLNSIEDGETYKPIVDISNYILTPTEKPYEHFFRDKESLRDLLSIRRFLEPYTT